MDLVWLVLEGMDAGRALLEPEMALVLPVDGSFVVDNMSPDIENHNTPKQSRIDN